jgi:hypothetical protein
MALPDFIGKLTINSLIKQVYSPEYFQFGIAMLKKYPAFLK